MTTTLEHLCTIVCPDAMVARGKSPSFERASLLRNDQSYCFVSSECTSEDVRHIVPGHEPVVDNGACSYRHRSCLTSPFYRSTNSHSPQSGVRWAGSD